MIKNYDYIPYLSAEWRNYYGKKNIDWSNLGFSYLKTDYRYVSNYKDGAWDEGAMITDDTVTISECAGVLQYAQTVLRD